MLPSWHFFQHESTSDGFFLVRHQRISRPLFSPLRISIITTRFFIKVNTATHQGLDAIRDTHWVLLHTQTSDNSTGSRRLLRTRGAKLSNLSTCLSTDQVCNRYCQGGKHTQGWLVCDLTKTCLDIKSDLDSPLPLYWADDVQPGNGGKPSSAGGQAAGCCSVFHIYRRLK